MNQTTIDDCRMLDLPRFSSPEGSISAAEGSRNLPFDIARVFFLYDIPGGESRGAHAHFELQQLIVPCLGAFDVLVDDGVRTRTLSLNSSSRGLYVPAGIWAHLMNFSSGAITLVLASLPYDESDYIRNHDLFVRLKHGDV